MNRASRLLPGGIFAAITFLHPSLAQRFSEPGHPIGTVTTKGNLIVLTLKKNALGKENLFDLAGRTLRFTPDGAAYRVETAGLEWDDKYGEEMPGPQAALQQFQFPFSGKTWPGFSVGVTGSITFGAATPAPGGPGGPGRGGRGGGVTIGRFDQLRDAARNLVNTVPAICVFMKPRMSGTRYLKELADRAVVTWSLTEPHGGIQDFTWTPTVNLFQAVLYKSGVIEMSYKQLNARDAVVGVYPLVNGGSEKPLASISGTANSAIPANLNMQSVKLSSVDGLFLKATFEMRGPVAEPGSGGVAGASYRVIFNSRPESAWTIRGFGPGRGGRGGTGTRYFASGPGVAGAVKVEGNTISMQGTLSDDLPAGKVTVSAETAGPGDVSDHLAAQPVDLSALHSPAVHLSSLKKTDGPFSIAYEAFHYYALPNYRDLTCSVIRGLGDKFDFLAYYSDFRVDNQEAGTPSNGPRGGNVSGIGDPSGRTQDYCSDGRFQWQFIQPVYVGANQMQEKSPEGVVVDRAGGKPMTGYNLAMSQIGHEMGHRWSAFVSAKVNGETFPLGPTHWARGLQAPAAFPYTRISEASAMGGGVWQDNFDGTFTQLDDDYYVPATGYSPLDLYLMGLAAPSEVPDFFILRNLAPAGRDANGHPIFKADRTKVTIQDVIAVEGLRTPTVDKSQKAFNTGMVVVVQHGKTPSRELIDRTNGIREKWMDYWSVTTGRRSTMTANPR